MSQNTEEEQPKFKLRKVILPVAIGGAISIYLIVTNFKPGALSVVHFSTRLLEGLLLAALAIVVRDFAFIYKIRLSSGEKLGWLDSLRVIIMWEFGAAITPKIGEVAFTLFVLKRGGLSYGRSTGMVILNSFLDNIVFVVVFAILYLALGHQILMVPTDCPDLTGNHIVQKLMLEIRHLADKAWIGYAIFCFIAAFFGVTLFVLPHSTKRFFYRLGDMKILHRFKGSLAHLGDEIEITANEYQNQSWMFWIKMTIATFINWSARYLLVNALVFAFTTGGQDAAQIYARQYVLWIFLVIPTTPGASGWAEISFIALNCEFLPVGLSAAIALVWRMYSYYIYLILGMIVLPQWLNSHTGKEITQ